MYKLSDSLHCMGSATFVYCMSLLCFAAPCSCWFILVNQFCKQSCECVFVSLSYIGKLLLVYSTRLNLFSIPVQHSRACCVCVCKVCATCLVYSMHVQHVDADAALMLAYLHAGTMAPANASFSS